MIKVLADFIKKLNPKQEVVAEEEKDNSKKLAKQRLHILLVQDRASVSAEFIDLMKLEIIEVIKKYVVIEEKNVDIDITNSISADGKKTETGLFVKIPIVHIRNEMKAEKMGEVTKETEELGAKKQEAIGDVEKELEEQEISNNIEAESIHIDMEVSEKEIQRIEDELKVEENIEEEKIKTKDKSKSKTKKINTKE